MKHPHAELLKQLIEDTTLSVEVMTGANEWGPISRGHMFHDTTGMRRYRIKPQPIKRPYIRIGQRWVPEPMREAPAVGTNYFLVGPFEEKTFVAAAPDLLKALQAMLTHMGMDEDEWNKPTFDQARAAIEKATGEQK